jgi:hypothetical protein
MLVAIISHIKHKQRYFMNTPIKIALFTSLMLSNAYTAETTYYEEREKSVRKAIDSFNTIEEKEISSVDSIGAMFSEGKLRAQIRSIFAGYNQKARNEPDTYATAIGGIIKYELAPYKGFSAAITGVMSQDISALSGDREKQNIELSSDKSTYMQIGELYVNYNYSNLNVRLGAQTLDTPFADSDDIRMVPNTFEAYMLTYEYKDFIFTLGNLQRWQGVDAGLGSGDNDEWVDIGDNGAWIGGITYDSQIKLNGWYYKFSGDIQEVEATYIDAATDYEISKNISFHTGIQYLHESDIGTSEIEADIYGVTAELVLYGIGCNIAYNYSDGKKNKKSFSGIGGGSMYTSMDTMIIDELTEDRDVHALVAGLVYKTENLELLYAYGDFDSKQNSMGESEHIVEQDIGITYSFSDALELGALYVMQEDKKNTLYTQNDWDRYQFILKYDF